MRKIDDWMLALATAMSFAVPAFAQDAPPAAPAGVEVLARGPVHEAYAEPVAGTPKASPLVPKKPPEPIEELPPDQKPAGDHVVWMPGYWSWDEERKDYLWVSGFWRSPPPGRQWTPGHWKEAEGGWQWVPGFWAAAPSAQQATEVTYLPPPPAPAQTAPSTPAPSPDYTYVPGCWVWRDGRYAWQPGYWVANRPNYVWVPAHYAWTPCGYVFVEGYWDYSLRERGLLFAPVYVSASLYAQPGYCYTPTYVVQDECLYGALFVRPGYSGYYFGDYFGPGYRGDYVAWCDYRYGYYRDPLFTYYSWQYRGDPGWAVGIRANYVSIYNGSVAPPPRTLIVQNTVVNNTVINNTSVVNNTAINNVRSTSMLAPLNQVKTVKLQPVPMAARQAQRQAARQVVQASSVRAQTEARVLAMGPPPTKLTDPPRSATMNLPRTPSAPLPGGSRAAPAMIPAHSVPHAQPTGQPATAPTGGRQPNAVHPASYGSSPGMHSPQSPQHQPPSPPAQHRPPPPPPHRPPPPPPHPEHKPAHER